MGFFRDRSLLCRVILSEKIIYFFGNTAIGGPEGGPFLDIIYIS